MRGITMRSAAVLALAVAQTMMAAGIVAPKVTVGRGLEASTRIRLPQANPEAEFKLTVTSDDPARLLLATGADRAGAAQITLTLQPNVALSPEFWLQALADGGNATYTVSAEGMESGKGTVTMARSAVVLLGPSRAPKFTITPRAEPAKLTVVTVALDDAGSILEEQPVAGGTQVQVGIANSNPAAGKLRKASLALAGGTSTADTWFEPAGEGETTLQLELPRGFIPAQKYASVVASVNRPGIAISGDLYLGKDLQLGGVLCLGEAAPAGGVEVTLRSGNPSKLVLSAKRDEPGTGTLRIQVPEGQLTAPYFLQGLGDAGEVAYQAEAPGFRTRTAEVGLTPSGVIVTYGPWGPPDEAVVLRKSDFSDDRAFTVSAADAKQHPVKLIVWTVYLDRRTGRAADITVQPLRAGVSVTVALQSSNPAVGTVDSPVTIRTEDDHAVTWFTPVAKGRTVISIETPAGFSTPKNATRVPATVSE